MQNRILVIEDDQIQQKAFFKILSPKYQLTQVENGEEGLRKIRQDRYDLVLLDIVLPGIDGLQVLEQTKRTEPDLLVIIITAYEKVDLIVKAIKLGIYDYLVKPLNLDELELTIEKALEAMKLKRELEQLRAYQFERSIMDKFIVKSEELKKVLAYVEKVAKSPDTSILIEGETGSGKELVATAIHLRSARHSGPFVRLNCAAIPRELIENELFGYERGSFTGGLREGKMGKFELSDGGTLLLDEVTELPLDCQGKLLRVLEEKKFYRIGGNREIDVDVRIIATTNRNIDKLLQEQKFREDLYYRLNVIRVSIPPLRERKEDIIPLSKYFIMRYNQKFGKNFHSVSPEAQRMLLDYHWKGNVRELKNVMERIVLSEDGEVVTSSILKNNFPALLPQSSKEVTSTFQLPVDGVILDDLIKDIITQALERTGGNKARAARLLGISKPTLLYRMEKYGIKKGLPACG